MRSAALAFLICALPRLVVLAMSPPPELTFYWYLSSTLLDSGTFGAPDSPDTHIEPLYPMLLAAARWITGDRLVLVFLLQVLLVSSAGVLLHRFTESLFGDRRAAWIALAFYAFDPYLVRQSVGNMETAILTAILIEIAWASRLGGTRGTLITALATAAAVLTRFSMLPLVVLVPLVLARRSKRDAAVVMLASLILIAPWSIRGARLDGSAMPSRAGLNLAVSMTDAAEQLLPQHNNDRLVGLLADKSDDELLADAWRSIRERPWRALEMKARNLLHVFNPRLLPYHHEPPTAKLRSEGGRYWIEGATPRSLASDWIHGLWRGALLLLAIAGVWTRGFRWDDGVLWAVVVTITAVCTLFYPTTRLTTPMVWTWMVWASLAFASNALRRIDAHGAN